jgi:diphthamide synthase subunit DPH2
MLLLGDDGAREITLRHVSKSGVVQNIVGMSGTQKPKKIKAAFGCCGCKEREKIIAHLRAKAVRSFMTCASIVDRNPGGRLERRAQHVSRFLDKKSFGLIQDTNDLPFGDGKPQHLQQRDQSGHGRLSLMVLNENEAFEFRPNMVVDAFR